MQPQNCDNNNRESRKSKLHNSNLRVFIDFVKKTNVQGQIVTIWEKYKSGINYSYYRDCKEKSLVTIYGDRY